MITFSGSNTLDRKLKCVDKPLFDNETIRLFSNSLERKKQTQELEVQIDSNNTRLTKSIIASSCSTASSNAGFSPNRKQSQSNSNKKRQSRDTILENPNILFASLSNDNLSIVDKEKSIEAIECIEKRYEMAIN
jgi:hypothetical protein